MWHVLVYIELPMRYREAAGYCSGYVSYVVSYTLAFAGKKNWLLPIHSGLANVSCR